MFAVGHVQHDPAGHQDVPPATDVFSFSANGALHGDLLGPGHPKRHRQLDRLRRRKLRRRLHRRLLHAVTAPRCKNIAEISTSTGKVVNCLRHSASKTSRPCELRQPHPGRRRLHHDQRQHADPYMTSLNPVTGKDDKFLHLNIKGNYQFPGVLPNVHQGLQPVAQPQRHARPGHGRLHQRRRPGQAADLHAEPRPDARDRDRLDLAASSMAATATFPGATRTSATPPSRSTSGRRPGHRTTRRSTSPTPATTLEPHRPARPGPGSATRPRPAGQPRNPCCTCGSTTPAATRSTRSRPTSTRSTSPGTSGGRRTRRAATARERADIPAAGFEGLGPATGKLNFNPTRDRGLGADDMLLTTAGLWIASDNFENSNKCAGVAHLAGICFLPY